MADPVDQELASVRTRPRRPKAEKRRPSVWWLLAGPAAPIARRLARTRIIDGHKLPATGAYIITPNHMSNIDPVVVGEAVWRLGRAPRFLAKASLFGVPVVGAMLRALGQIPVERGGASRGAIPLSAAKRLIAEGQGVIVYPEGSLTRDPDLWPMRGKTGAARLALVTGAPVVPVANWGAERIFDPRTSRLNIRPRTPVTVTAGRPIDLSRWSGATPNRAVLVEMTEAIMQDISALLGEVRGEQPPAILFDRQARTGEDGR
jgi:1-acyl-sn-glycerol-3-phosphate acyltransferase